MSVKNTIFFMVISDLRYKGKKKPPPLGGGFTNSFNNY